MMTIKIYKANDGKPPHKAMYLMFMIMNQR